MPTKQTDNIENLRAERANAQDSLRELQREYDGIEERIQQQAREDALAKTRAARNGDSPAAVEDRAPELRARRDELPYLIDAAQIRHAAAVVAVLEVEDSENLAKLSEATEQREKLDAEVEPLIQRRNKALSEEQGLRQRRQQVRSDLQNARRRLREAERP